MGRGVLASLTTSFKRSTSSTYSSRVSSLRQSDCRRHRATNHTIVVRHLLLLVLLIIELLLHILKHHWKIATVDTNRISLAIL